MTLEECNSHKIELLEKTVRLLRVGELPEAAGLVPKAMTEWTEPRSLHWFLGWCTIKGTTGVVCYVSNYMLNAVCSHGPQFQTGPDLSSKVSPSESKSYADSNSWIRIKAQLWPSRTNSIWFISMHCSAAVFVQLWEVWVNHSQLWYNIRNMRSKQITGAEHQSLCQ